MRYVMLLLPSLIMTLTESTKLCEKKCFLGQPCNPSQQDWTVFVQSLQQPSDFVWPSHPMYAHLNTMKNARVKSDVGAIVFVNNVDDVKKCVKFAKKFNIRVSIWSTGHSFIGRSTFPGSLMINMGKLQDIDVNPAPTNRSAGGEITVETGNNWAKVYEEVDRHNRIVVGGSAHTVGMGGYTQGGGHSPMSRSLGLAVDNLLELQLVNAEGHLVTASADGTINHDTGINSTDADLFWALRGGGGGTWGVVISFTFKLHIPPSGFVQYVAGYGMHYNGSWYGNRSLQNVLTLMENLPRQWGGYVVMSTESETPGVTGGFLLSLLHYGPWGSESFNAIYPLYNDVNAGFKFFVNKTSFWDYSQNVTDPDVSSYRSYVVNSLIQPNKSGDDLANVLTDEMFRSDVSAATGCTFTMLGGKMQEPQSDTPVSPGFRSAAYSLSCGRLWADPRNDSINIAQADRFNSRLQEFGDGVYFNEPAENLKNWKTAFWGKGGNYVKLLRIKKKVDPTNFFCCHNCVGFDLEEEKKPEKVCSSSGAKQVATLVGILLVSSGCILFE